MIPIITIARRRTGKPAKMNPEHPRPTHKSSPTKKPGPASKVAASRQQPPTTKAAAAAAKPNGSHKRTATPVDAPPAHRTPANRPRRGGPVDEFHNETFIPPADPTVKPTPPRRDPGDDSTRFTAEDKVFFIHYLRWALLRKPTMDKSDLYEALATEVRRPFLLSARLLVEGRDVLTSSDWLC